MTKSTLEEFKVNIRVKLAALWTGVMFCYIYGDYFELYVPGKTAGLLSGQNLLNSPLRLFIITVLLTLPALLIFLTLLLRPVWSRWLNVGTGIFFTLFTLLVGFASFSEWRAFYVFLSFLESIITTIIIWQAWNWPRIKP